MTRRLCRRPLALSLVVLLLAAGCTDADLVGEPEPIPTPTPPSSRSGPPESPLAAAVEHPLAELLDVRVTRDGDRLTVASVWRCSAGSCPEPGTVIAVSDDGFATRDLRPGSWENIEALFPSPYDGLPERLPDDLGPDRDARVVPVLSGGRPDVVALAGGVYDGVYFPFAKAWRSEDGGASWASYDVSGRAGALPYSSGHVVLSDGRLLSAIPWWSDDRIDGTSDGASDRPRGLVVSDGDDWAALSEFTARFDPPLDPVPEGWAEVEELAGSVSPDPVLWARSGKKRVYVSTDDGETFRETATR